jgi:hypothetical protein
MGRDVTWMYFDDADDEPALVDLPKMGTVSDVIYDLKIIQATIDVAIDAQESTSIETLMLMLEGVSAQLRAAQEKLDGAIQ